MASKFSAALRAAIDRMQLGEDVEDAEVQAPTDEGAEVLIVHMDGGKRLLVTIEELGS